MGVRTDRRAIVALAFVVVAGLGIGLLLVANPHTGERAVAGRYLAAWQGSDAATAAALSCHAGPSSSPWPDVAATIGRFEVTSASPWSMAVRVGGTVAVDGAVTTVGLDVLTVDDRTCVASVFVGPDAARAPNA